MSTPTDIALYNHAKGGMVAARTKASQLISQATTSLQNALWGWETNAYCPSGNYGVPPDVLAVAIAAQRIFVSTTTEEKEIAEALAHYYTEGTDAQKKWALLLPQSATGFDATRSAHVRIGVRCHVIFTTK